MFTTKELYTIQLALTVAAEHYEAHALFLRDKFAPGTLHESAANHFEERANEARALLARIEDSE